MFSGVKLICKLIKAGRGVKGLILHFHSSACVHSLDDPVLLPLYKSHVDVSQVIAPIYFKENTPLFSLLLYDAFMKQINMLLHSKHFRHCSI